MDYILNGQAHGVLAGSSPVAQLLQHNMDPRALRPYFGDDGRTPYIDQVIGMNADGTPNVVAVPTINANATLTRDQWKQIDDTVQRIALNRLGFVDDIRSAGLTYNVSGGFGKTILESEREGDMTDATISMDPARESEYDRPEFDVVGIPLPVIHKDGYFSARQIAASRSNGGLGLDTRSIESATRKVLEERERLFLGTAASFTYGGYTLYGVTNFPNRITKALTHPETSGWTPKTLVNEILQMRQSLTDALFFGPFRTYFSPGWAQYLDMDYSDDKGDNTLRERIEAVQGVGTIGQANFLTGLQVVMFQATTDVIRAVTGMDLTTLQWDTHGGMKVHFKVMLIEVPDLRAQQNGNSGIAHGVAVENDLM